MTAKKKARHLRAVQTSPYGRPGDRVDDDGTTQLQRLLDKGVLEEVSGDTAKETGEADAPFDH